jgi:hypothetical protein
MTTKNETTAPPLQQAQCETCGGSGLQAYPDRDTWHSSPNEPLPPCPDCAPSPEQQGAEQTYPYNSVPLPQGVKPVDEHRLKEILSGYEEFRQADLFEIRSLAYEVRNFRMRTAPAPALGLTQDERDALGSAIDALYNEAGDEKAKAESYSEGTSSRAKYWRRYEQAQFEATTLRSLLERVKP